MLLIVGVEKLLTSLSYGPLSTSPSFPSKSGSSTCPGGKPSTKCMTNSIYDMVGLWYGIWVGWLWHTLVWGARSCRVVGNGTRLIGVTIKGLENLRKQSCSWGKERVNWEILGDGNFIFGLNFLIYGTIMVQNSILITIQFKFGHTWSKSFILGPNCSYFGQFWPILTFG